MSTKITIEISTANDEAYTERELAIIASLQAHPSQGTEAVVPEPVKAAPAKAAPAKVAPAKVTRAEKNAEPTPPTKAAVLDETLDVAPESTDESEEDLVGATYTLEDAVAAATQRVSAGKATEVKAALASVGAKRVSELKGASITTFMQALNA